MVYYSFVVLRSIMDSYRLGEMWAFLDWMGLDWILCEEVVCGSMDFVNAILLTATRTWNQNQQTSSPTYTDNKYHPATRLSTHAQCL